MNRTAVINVVGLTPSLIGPATPNIARFANRGRTLRIDPAFPTVTCTAQANYLTGRLPSQHGIVANGWYDRALSEVHFWKQSNRLVGGEKIWDKLKSPEFTCANLFWWFNMYSTVDYSITPRPMYPADGRKFFDIYSWPGNIRPEIKRDLGEFPFATFWGPAAGVNTPQGSLDAASRWIANAAKWMERRNSPTLNLIYLPHLDYNLQRHGPYLRGGKAGELNPDILPDLAQIDSIVGDLISFFDARGVRVVLLSEYGITNVETPVHLNRLFREKGWITVREELGLELLDCGASKVFAVADHQVAHIYVREPAMIPEVAEFLAKQTGVEKVLGEAEQKEMGIHHSRGGDLIAVADDSAWFTYYYWQDDALAPDFARCVDIHRKPGYDPVELFLDPKIPLPKLKILWRLAQKKLGFRMLMDVIPLDASLVRGSHGRVATRTEDQPVLISDLLDAGLSETIKSTDVAGILTRTLTGVV